MTLRTKIKMSADKKLNITINVTPVPLEQLLTKEFEVESQKLLRLYYSAPELKLEMEALLRQVALIATAYGIEDDLFPTIRHAQHFLSKFD